jgi:hypothetical protein
MNRIEKNVIIAAEKAGYNLQLRLNSSPILTNFSLVGKMNTSNILDKIVYPLEQWFKRTLL